MEQGTQDERWHARPVWSGLLRVLVLVIPVAAGVAAAIFLSQTLPRPDGFVGSALWWIGLFVASATAASLVDRVARKMLPLAALLGLTMIFPDKAPSRFAVARRVGSVRNLEERVRHAQEHGIEDDPARAAETILTLVAALNLHDRKTRGHSERVRALTDMLADELRLERDARDRLRWAALLHDIGKLEVEARVLNKPGKPTPDEWESLKRHPEEGARIAGPLLPWLGEWGMAIRQHHERFDGGGYPLGMVGSQLSLAGRMLTVTDSFETMTAARSYKKPMSVVRARRELARCAGSQFDPVVVRAFLNISLGRLVWQVGPASWLAQLPFVGIRGITGPIAAAAKFAVGALARTVFGLAAIGATGMLNVPAHGEQRPSISREISTTAAALDREIDHTRESRPHPRPGDTSDDDGTGGDGDGGPGPGDDPSDPGDGGLVDRVKDTVQDPVGAVGDIVEDPVGTVGDVVNDTTDTVNDVVNDTTDTVNDVVNDTTDTVNDTVDDVGDALGGL
ncbi:MAG TPA: HD domain-containing phosphohydrolase [Actinomycetota bacterium]|nr:HD domain-containing phosphohydrolase [Actinomycetota bacterium]